MLKYRPLVLRKSLRVRKGNLKAIAMPEVSNDKIQKVLMKIATGLRLREAKIEKFGRQFTNTGAKYLFQILKHMKIFEKNSRTNNLELSFNKSELSGDGLSFIAASLRQIYGLRSLRLEFKG